MAELSIIIPTFNAIPVLGPTLAALAQIEAVGLVKDVVISDGGSTDDTAAAARETGAIVVETQRGRGPQLQAGADAATGDWLLFLHADTVLAPGWADVVRAFRGHIAPPRRRTSSTTRQLPRSATHHPTRSRALGR